VASGPSHLGQKIFRAHPPSEITPFFKRETFLLEALGTVRRLGASCHFFLGEILPPEVRMRWRTITLSRLFLVLSFHRGGGLAQQRLFPGLFGESLGRAEKISDSLGAPRISQLRKPPLWSRRLNRGLFPRNSTTFAFFLAFSLWKEAPPSRAGSISLCSPRKFPPSCPKSSHLSWRRPFLKAFDAPRRKR